VICSLIWLVGVGEMGMVSSALPFFLQVPAKCPLSRASPLRGAGQIPCSCAAYTWVEKSNSDIYLVGLFGSQIGPLPNCSSDKNVRLWLLILPLCFIFQFYSGPMWGRGAHWNHFGRAATFSKWKYSISSWTWIAGK
jgi:hypothetical protein